MKQIKSHTILEIALFAVLLLLFGYFRLKPIYLQTVPYTFDQGRDFLKASEMVRGGDITFIGPTTGIQGLFHGAWWYYFLSVPFFIFNGAPQGFYYAVFALALAQVALFWLFLRKTLNSVVAFFFLALIAISPYFIKTSIFAINTVLTLPVLLVFLFALYRYIEKKNTVFLFLIFLNLGFLLEAELAFGMFIIPAFFLTVVLLKMARLFFGSRQKVVISATGLIIPLVPRLLFELKNNFLQSKALITYIQNPSATNRLNFRGVLFDRLRLFREYYEQLFVHEYAIIAPLIGIVAVTGILYGFRILTKSQRKYTAMLILLVILLYALSLVIKDNFFWANYFEGLPYLYVMILSLGIFVLSKSRDAVVRLVPNAFIVVLVLIAITAFHKDVKTGTEPKNEGLRWHVSTIDYIYDRVDRDDFCLKIYTPPVFAHTYNYLIDYYTHTRSVKWPTDVFKDSCWYIVEHDDYEERVVQWRAQNIPAHARLVSKKKLDANVAAELWEIK